LGFLFCGCLFVCWFVFFFWGFGCFVHSCMYDPSRRREASKQAIEQMGHHYLQMGGTHCTTSSYLVPKILWLDHRLSSSSWRFFVQLHFVHLPFSPCCWKISNNRTPWCRVVYKWSNYYFFFFLGVCVGWAAWNSSSSSTNAPFFFPSLSLCVSLFCFFTIKMKFF
jgi:hypothetical protein